MKTINELGIYFMCCFIFATLFITYLSVKLRAYRIKNNSLTNRIEIADKDIADAYDNVDKVNLELKEASNAHDDLLSVFTQVGKDFDKHRTESAAIINQSAENNAKLVAEIEHLKQSYQSGSSATALFYETQIETLKSDRQKLFDIAKGATAKLAEMNIALEGLEVDEKDWSISQPFPENYQVPPLTKVLMIESNHPIVGKGCEGVVREKNYSAIPYTRVDWDYGKTLSAYSHQLAPLNPLDHPNHPNFRG